MDLLLEGFGPAPDVIPLGQPGIIGVAVSEQRAERIATARRALALLMLGYDPLAEAPTPPYASRILAVLPAGRQIERRWTHTGSILRASWLADDVDHAAVLTRCAGATEAQRHVLYMMAGLDWRGPDWADVLVWALSTCAAHRRCHPDSADGDRLRQAVRAAWMAEPDRETVRDVAVDLGLEAPRASLLDTIIATYLAGGTDAALTFVAERSAELVARMETVEPEPLLHRAEAGRTSHEELRRLCAEAEAAVRVASIAAQQALIIERTLQEQLRRLDRLERQRPAIEAMRAERDELDALDATAAQQRTPPPYPPLLACRDELQRCLTQLREFPATSAPDIRPEPLTEHVHELERQIEAIRALPHVRIAAAPLRRLEWQVATMRFQVWSLWEWQVTYGDYDACMRDRHAVENRIAHLRIQLAREESAARREHLLWEQSRESARELRARRRHLIDEHCDRYARECALLMTDITSLRAQHDQCLRAAPAEALHRAEAVLADRQDALRQAEGHRQRGREHVRLICQPARMAEVVTAPYRGIVRALHYLDATRVIDEYVASLNATGQAMGYTRRFSAELRPPTIRILGHYPRKLVGESPTTMGAWPMLVQCALLAWCAPEIGFALFDGTRCHMRTIGRVACGLAQTPHVTASLIAYSPQTAISDLDTLSTPLPHTERRRE